ncbi:hypothetical protein WJX73_002322 [Symbiochloris irregularis]|uniref:Uncharacterized protein n=1 Tax=Symbiochloris irregularis TaxID=706552 RepID=A0AAW1NWD7_9CHLO
MANNKKVKIDLDDDAKGEGVEGDHEDSLVEGIFRVQNELEQLNDEASDKVLEVEAHFNKLRKPVYSRRAEAIARVPDFWYQCFVQHPLLAQSSTEEDSEILSYLRQIHVEDFKDLKTGYKIIFIFEENPYFSNKELSKSFAFDTLDDGMMVCSGEAIHWYPGKDPTKKAEAEASKGSKRARPLEESFFLWFPEADLPYETATDPIADVIKDQLWVNPVKYYLGDVDDWEQDPHEEGEPAPHIWNGEYVEADEGQQGEYREDDDEEPQYEDEDEEEEEDADQPTEEYAEEGDAPQEPYDEEEGDLQEQYEEEEYDEGAEEGEPPDPEGEQEEDAYEDEEDAEGEEPQGV